MFSYLVASLALGIRYLSGMRCFTISYHPASGNGKEKEEGSPLLVTGIASPHFSPTGQLLGQT